MARPLISQDERVVSLMEMIRKRHDGDGWYLFEELANGTGYKVRGWADAAALGVWPSRGYEFHGYEVKISREDLKRELRDPTKADNIGRYCHFWWLVLADEKLMDGLVVPEVWGILVPRGKILRVLRKAPRVKTPTPFDAAFCAAMIRNVVKTWVPRHEHERMRESALERARAELAADRRVEASQHEREVIDLRHRIERFKKESGVDISDLSTWELRDVGRAVKALVRAYRIDGTRPEVADQVRREAREMERAGERFIKAAERAADSARQMMELADRLADDETALDGEPSAEGCRSGEPVVLP